jgi:hypothetical protein
MRIYIFKSDANKELRAFSDDPSGTKLPGRFRPWHAFGFRATRSRRLSAIADFSSGA